MTSLHHQAGAIRAIIAMIALAFLFACTGCSSIDNGQTFEETERVICAGVGQGAMSSLARHGGYATRCAWPE